MNVIVALANVDGCRSRAMHRLMNSRMVLRLRLRRRMVCMRLMVGMRILVAFKVLRVHEIVAVFTGHLAVRWRRHCRRRRSIRVFIADCIVLATVAMMVHVLIVIWVRRLLFVVSGRCGRIHFAGHNATIFVRIVLRCVLNGHLMIGVHTLTVHRGHIMRWMIVKALLIRMEIGHFAMLEFQCFLMGQVGGLEAAAVKVTFDVMEIGFLVGKMFTLRRMIEWHLIWAGRSYSWRLPMMRSKFDFIFSVVIGVRGLLAVKAIVAATDATTATVLYGRIRETIFCIRRLVGWRRRRELVRRSIIVYGTVAGRRGGRLAIADGDGCRIWLSGYITSLLHFKTIVE